MKRKIFVLLMALMIVASANAWSFKGLVDGVKEKFRGEPEPKPTIVETDNGHQHQVRTIERERVNLGKKALLYKLALLGKDKDCEEWGGTWHWAEDKIGCVGVDMHWDCNKTLVNHARNKCEDNDAEFVCGTQGMYCTNE